MRLKIQFGLKLVGTAATAALVGALAIPGAQAASTSLPITAVTGGGPGGSSWGQIQDDGSACQDSGGFSISDAQLDPGDTTSVGNQTDAFDDAWLLSDAAGGSSGSYFKAGTAVDLTGSTVTTSDQPFGGLAVTTSYMFFQDAARLRTMYTFTNMTSSTVTHTFQTETDLGSDNNTAIVATSSGDASWTTADRWLTTWQQTDTPPPSDPVVSTVMFGPGTVQKPDVVSFACGTVDPVPDPRSDYSGGLLRSVWTVSVPAGETRHLVFFTDLNQITSAGVSSETVYDAMPTATSALFAGIPSENLPDILNWEFQVPATTSVPPTAVITTTTTRYVPMATTVTPRFTG